MHAHGSTSSTSAGASTSLTTTTHDKFVWIINNKVLQETLQPSRYIYRRRYFSAGMHIMRMQSGTERGRRRNFLFLEFLRFSFNLPPSFSLLPPSFRSLSPVSTLRFSVYLSTLVFPSRLGDELWRPLNVEGTYRGLHRRNNDSTLLHYNDRSGDIAY